MLELISASQDKTMAEELASLRREFRGEIMELKERVRVLEQQLANNPRGEEDKTTKDGSTPMSESGDGRRRLTGSNSAKVMFDGEQFHMTAGLNVSGDMTVGGDIAVSGDITASFTDITATGEITASKLKDGTAYLSNGGLYSASLYSCQGISMSSNSNIAFTGNGYISSPNKAFSWLVFPSVDSYPLTNTAHDVVWPYEREDNGYAHDDTTGIYTAPINGVYVLFAALDCDGGTCAVCFRMNGVCQSFGSTAEDGTVVSFQTIMDVDAGAELSLEATCSVYSGCTAKKSRLIDGTASSYLMTYWGGFLLATY